MHARGFNPQFTDPTEMLPDGLDVWRMSDWTPDAEALALNRQRIAERNAQAKPPKPAAHEDWHNAWI